MSSKRNLLILAVLTVSALAPTAFANPTSESNAAWQVSDAEVPASPDYKNRVISGSEDSNAAWQSLESDNPHSVDFAKRPTSGSTDVNAVWSASEIDNPHSVQSVDEMAAAVQ